MEAFVQYIYDRYLLVGVERLERVIYDSVESCKARNQAYQRLKVRRGSTVGNNGGPTRSIL
jgi:hypothetical protein